MISKKVEVVNNAVCFRKKTLNDAILVMRPTIFYEHFPNFRSESCKNIKYISHTLITGIFLYPPKNIRKPNIRMTEERISKITLLFSPF